MTWLISPRGGTPRSPRGPPSAGGVFDGELLQERFEILRQLRKQLVKAVMTGAGSSSQTSQALAYDLAEALRADIAGGPHCGHMSRAEVHRLGKTPWEIQQFVAEVRRGIGSLVRLAGEPLDAKGGSSPRAPKGGSSEAAVGADSGLEQSERALGGGPGGRVLVRAGRRVLRARAR